MDASDKAAQAADELRAVIREAHEANKDLRETLKTVKRDVTATSEEIVQMYRANLVNRCEQNLEEVNSAAVKALENILESVHAARDNIWDATGRVIEQLAAYTDKDNAEEMIGAIIRDIAEEIKPEVIKALDRAIRRAARKGVH